MLASNSRLPSSKRVTRDTAVLVGQSFGSAVATKVRIDRTASATGPASALQSAVRWSVARVATAMHPIRAGGCIDEPGGVGPGGVGSYPEPGPDGNRVRSAEVVALLEIVDEPGVCRLPSGQL